MPAATPERKINDSIHTVALGELSDRCRIEFGRNFDAAVCGAVSDHAAHAAHTDESDSHSEEFLTSESPRQRATNAAFRGGLESYA